MDCRAHGHAAHPLAIEAVARFGVELIARFQQAWQQRHGVGMESIEEPLPQPHPALAARNPPEDLQGTHQGVPAGLAPGPRYPATR